MADERTTGSDGGDGTEARVDPANYTDDEEAGLRAAAVGGKTPACPRCGDVMDRRGVPPRPDVAYVRDRIWLTCRGCRRSAVFDSKRLGPKEGR